MKARRTNISLDDAEEGMVLSDALLDAGGGVLLPQGAELTASMLQGLSRRGVEWISIVDNSVSEEELAKEREKLEQRLTSLFRKSVNRKEDEALRQTIARYRLGG